MFETLTESLSLNGRNGRDDRSDDVTKSQMSVDR